MKIAAENLCVEIQRNLILENISFVLPANSSTAIVGESMIGKTTLLRTIAGFLSPSNGKVLINGDTPTSLYKKHCIEYLFQESCLWPHLKLMENLRLSAKLHEITITNDGIKNILESVGLSDDYNKYPYQLSVGGRARVAIARAFCNKPQLLLMDEPFASLDPIRRQELLKKTQDYILKAGATAIWVTHDLVEAIRFSTNIIVLAKKPAQLAKMINNTLSEIIEDAASLPMAALALRNELIKLIYEKK